MIRAILFTHENYDDDIKKDIIDTITDIIISEEMCFSKADTPIDRDISVKTINEAIADLKSHLTVNMLGEPCRIFIDDVFASPSEFDYVHGYIDGVNSDLIYDYNIRMLSDIYCVDEIPDHSADTFNGVPTDFRVFISIPMKGIPIDNIDWRIEQTMLHEIPAILGPSKKPILVRSQLYKDGYEHTSAEMLADSIRIMSGCDGVFFADGWKYARGCKIEHEIAVEYGLNIIHD